MKSLLTVHLAHLCPKPRGSTPGAATAMSGGTTPTDRFNRIVATLAPPALHSFSLARCYGPNGAAAIQQTRGNEGGMTTRQCASQKVHLSRVLGPFGLMSICILLAQFALPERGLWVPWAARGMVFPAFSRAHRFAPVFSSFFFPDGPIGW